MGKNVAELKPNMISNEEVDTAIGKFKTLLGTSKTAAQHAAVAALIHCFQHRTAAKLRDMLVVIENEGADFVRRAPFTLWLAMYAPVKMVSKEITDGEKTKRVRVLEFDAESPLLTAIDETIAKAEAKLWWTMSKDKEIGAFDVVNFDKRILGIAKKALKEIDESVEEVDETARNHVLNVFADFSSHVAVAKVTKLKAA
ncbi:MAG: hypothetical protein MN733_20200 [Nitrososphaera sp.]|nr:hypothetical protein [Nitrososphaera sp.]